MENNVNEVVEMMTKVDPETLAEANEALLNKAIVETEPALPAAAQTKPATNGKGIAISIGTFLGGIAAGVAIDHWVVPAIGKSVNKLKAKRKLKKAEKKAKKAVRNLEKAVESATEAPAADDGIDPNTLDPNKEMPKD